MIHKGAMLLSRSPLNVQTTSERQTASRSVSSFELAQVIVEGLYVCEDAHGVWLAAHYHHILNLDETITASLLPGKTKMHKECKATPVPVSIKLT